ncbi:MAG: type II secretion system F family protein, partial [Planctomycetales bacterium]|nr:type II secretion system F family protein [Planctomycetales bacterium]
MTSSVPSSPQSVSLESWIALHRELAQLAAQGLPFEPELTSIANDFGGATGKLAGRLHASLEAGVPLPQALAELSPATPLEYRAAVEAGLQSGRLAEAFEGIVTSATRLEELRRLTLAGLMYPALVLSVAWIALVLHAAYGLPAYAGLEADGSYWLSAIRLPARVAWVVAAAVPLLLATGIGLWWRRTDRPEATWRWLPFSRRVARFTGYARFSHLLAMQWERRTPWQAAIARAC